MSTAVLTWTCSLLHAQGTSLAFPAAELYLFPHLLLYPQQFHQAMASPRKSLSLPCLLAAAGRASSAPADPDLYRHIHSQEQLEETNRHQFILTFGDGFLTLQWPVQDTHMKTSPIK